MQNIKKKIMKEIKRNFVIIQEERVYPSIFLKIRGSNFLFITEITYKYQYFVLA